MRDINFKNENGHVTITENNYFNQKRETDIKYKIKEVKTKELVKEKVKELYVSIIFAIFSILLDTFKKNVELEKFWPFIILIIFFIFIIASIVFFLSFICDLIQILKLNKVGKCIHFQSKQELVRQIINIFKESNESSSEECIGALFKNENGNVYEVIGAQCPFCNSEPIGEMRPMYIQKGQGYIFECSENPNHKLYFDYKNKII